MKTNVSFFAALALLAQTVHSAGQGSAFTYQGGLSENGVPANGIYDLRFTIHDLANGGSEVAGAVTNAATTLSNGFFAATLDFGANVFSGAPRWLEIGVRTNGSSAFTILAPRQRLTATPYAITAGDVVSANVARLDVPNTAMPATGVPTVANGFVIGAAVTSGGSGYTTPPTVVINDSLGSGAIITATVSNGIVTSLAVQNAGSGYSSGAALIIDPPPSNGYQLFVSTNYFVGVNTLTNPGNIIAGNGAALTSLNASHLTSGTVPDAQLASNLARTNQVWLVGGNSDSIPETHFLGTTDNQPLELRVNNRRALRVEPTAFADTLNIVAGSPLNFVAPGVSGVTIAGGGVGGAFPFSNSVASDSGTIGGGRGNAIAMRSSFSTIAGGYLNIIGSNSQSVTIGGGTTHASGIASEGTTIAGGRANTIGNNADFGAIGGGIGNTLGDNVQYGTIGGGWNNVIALNAQQSVIGGGVGNVIGTNSTYSVIAGGWNNDVANDSPYAFVAGSYGNFASTNCFAAGSSARANHFGSFVWADNFNSPLASTNANSLTMRARGGYRLFSNGNASTGVFLAPGGGSWTAMSDRNTKENFEPVDSREVLNKVAALPLSTWNYKSQPTDMRHIGPMAQDFKAAFSVGESDTGITSVDADGVALAAIQGLNQKLEEQLQSKEARITALEQTVAELKEALKGFAEQRTPIEQ